MLNSSSGAAYVDYGAGMAYAVGKSVNPSDVIIGILMKKGFIIADRPKK